MGSPHTVDICANCREPIVQWNNTGAWEHLSSATMDQTKSRVQQRGSKSRNLNNGVLCHSAEKAKEVLNKSGKTDANWRTATKP